MEIPLAANHGVDGFVQIVAVGALDHVPGCPGAQGLSNRLGIPMHRDDHDPRVRSPRPDLAQQRHAIRLAERQVEQEDVGVVALEELEGSGGRRRFADDVEAA